MEATQVATKEKSKRTTKKPEWTMDYVSSVDNDSYTATWVANVTNHACDCVSFSGMSHQQSRDKSRRRDQSRDTRRSSRERDDSREPRAGRDRQREQATDRPFNQPRPSLGGLGEQSRGGMQFYNSSRRSQAASTSRQSDGSAKRHQDQAPGASGTRSTFSRSD